MSPDNLVAQIKAERERGDAALAAAKTLLAADLYYDAASRAYYGAFHYARALCLASGDEPRSHQGVAHFLNMSYVRSGKLAAFLSVKSGNSVGGARTGSNRY
ncbi:MAG: HEPN domain-containing protein [Myxococcaceae bacterium]